MQGITLVTTPSGKAFVFGEGTYENRATIKALGFEWNRSAQNWVAFGIDVENVAKALGVSYKQTVTSQKHGEEVIYQ